MNKITRAQNRDVIFTNTTDTVVTHVLINGFGLYSERSRV